MKKTLVVLALLLALCSFGQRANAQQFVQSLTLTSASAPTIFGSMSQNANVVTHVVTWTSTAGTGAISSCTMQLQSSSDNVTFASLGGSQTCTSSGSFAAAGAFNFIRINMTAATLTGNATVVVSYFGYTSAQSAADNVWWVPLQACGEQLTTGALAAASTVAQNPGIQNVAANNAVLAVTTSAAASAMTLDCDIVPPFRTSTGKGTIITGVNVFFGYQGAAALSSITGPTITTVTYAVAGGAAGATISGALGGALSTTVGTSHGAPGAVTTTGQCYSEGTTFGTPILLNSTLARLTLEEVFNHTTASLATYQICGVSVTYVNFPL